MSDLPIHLGPSVYMHCVKCGAYTDGKALYMHHHGEQPGDCSDNGRHQWEDVHAWLKTLATRIAGDDEAKKTLSREFSCPRGWPDRLASGIARPHPALAIRVARFIERKLLGMWPNG